MSKEVVSPPRQRMIEVALAPAAQRVPSLELLHATNLFAARYQRYQLDGDATSARNHSHILCAALPHQRPVTLTSRRTQMHKTGNDRRNRMRKINLVVIAATLILAGTMSTKAWDFCVSLYDGLAAYRQYE